MEYNEFAEKHQEEAKQLLKHYFRKQVKCREINIKSRKSVPILHCDEFFDIFKIIGRLKYYFSRHRMFIVYRGQRKPYDYLLYPAFARDFFKKGKKDYIRYKRSEKHLNELVALMGNQIDEILKEQSEFEIANNPYYRIEYFRDLIWEPLLQHYNINTRWLDVVDTIPNGIWFSIFDYKNQIIDREGLGFLFVLGVHYYDSIIDGYKSSDVNLIANLRTISPPLALRPHVQHALVLTDKRFLNSYFDHKTLTKNMGILHVSQQGDYEAGLAQYDNRMDLNRLLLCVISFKKEKAIKWLCGERSDLPENLKVKTMFPPSSQDFFYKKLLHAQNINEEIKSLIKKHKVLGKIE